MTVLDRRAARVVLVDGAGRALLLRGGDPARPGLRWWFTPGGGLDEGETPAEGAARELFEETGLRVEAGQLGEPVWHQVTEFSYDGRDYRQDQEFFLFRVPSWEVDTAGFDPEEQRTIDGHRWWSAAELDETGETIYPEELASLLRRLIGVSSPPSVALSPGSSAAASPPLSAVVSPPSSVAVSRPSSAAASGGPGC